MNIYHYDTTTGCLLSDGVPDANPLDPSHPLLPAYATPAPAPLTNEFECARYIDAAGDVPAHHADGSWVIQPDWRGVPLWSTEDGSAMAITEPNVIPDERGATAVAFPGPGHVWDGAEWQPDPAAQYELAEQSAEQELARRDAEAAAEIARIQPAVEGGYAKPADVELLPKWQRYRYELPDVREQMGWPEAVEWPDKPSAVV